MSDRQQIETGFENWGAGSRMTNAVNAEEKTERRSFTGDKLDWMAAVSADPRLDARAFEVAFCIAQHLSQKSGSAFVADDTIADKTGIPRRAVIQARMKLLETGWIDWHWTQTANVYRTLSTNMNAVTDHQIMLKEARDERRATNGIKNADVPKLTQQPAA